MVKSFDQWANDLAVSINKKNNPEPEKKNEEETLMF